LHTLTVLYIFAPHNQPPPRWHWLFHGHHWPIFLISAAIRPQVRTSIEFSSLAVFLTVGAQTCEPGTHPGSHFRRS